ncbi:LamG-like jellyroll fold domain-containing protein [Sphingobacterium psychroaquaticum]|uniref:Uncharacterized protein n=1 Tax=Sphingobacterium psychroaquaticum TaxID=561061 RepID=A0A1X7LB31_9SPHI|nr:LamG-like jellyroll fold domain-containing protein [Sphingobacterium psychroaquaticum]SMG51056.1 protein of unknown function [Sphingobacterium psychroaquaticum]
MKIFYTSVFVALFLSVGCTRYDNPQPSFEEYELPQDTVIKNKVLVITVDGLVGAQLKEYKPTVMAKMLEKSKYSYAAQSDLDTKDPASMVTLLTGYPSSIHKVVSESYLPVFDPSKPHAELGVTPSVIYRLEEKDSKNRTAAIMRNMAVTNSFLGEADFSAVETSDEEVKAKAVNFLKNNNTDFMFVQLSEVQTAGVDGGFLISNPKYKAALDKADAQIGEIKAALEARANYANENWLIVVCSSHGGTATGDFGGVSMSEMGTFTMYYNKDFLPVELKADPMSTFFANGYFPGTYTHYDGKATRTFSETGVRAQSPAGAGSNMFNPSTTGEMTFEFKMKLREDNFWAGLSFAGGYRNYYNYFLGKDASDGTNAGWHIRGQDMALRLRVQNGSATDELEFSRGTDGLWNHFTIVFKAMGTKTLATVYVNGTRAASKEVPYAVAAFQNTEPLTIGFNTSDTRMAFVNADMADVRVWNKAMDDKQVDELACMKWVANDYPLRSNLVAYYSEFNGATWKNTAGTSAPDMTLSGRPAVNVLSNYKPCKTGAEEVFVQNIDLVPQVFYWMNITANDNWKLSGNVFLKNFENEFRK